MGTAFQGISALQAVAYKASIRMLEFVSDRTSPLREACSETLDSVAAAIINCFSRLSRKGCPVVSESGDPLPTTPISGGLCGQVREFVARKCECYAPLFGSRFSCIYRTSRCFSKLANSRMNLKNAIAIFAASNGRGHVLRNAF